MASNVLEMESIFSNLCTKCSNQSSSIQCQCCRERMNISEIESSKTLLEPISSHIESLILKIECQFIKSIEKFKGKPRKHEL